MQIPVALRHLLQYLHPNHEFGQEQFKNTNIKLCISDLQQAEKRVHKHFQTCVIREHFLDLSEYPSIKEFDLKYFNTVIYYFYF